MWEYLRELNRQGTTIILTTHYLEEVEQMCRRAAIIKQGEIVRLDTVANLTQGQKLEKIFLDIIKDEKDQ